MKIYYALCIVATLLCLRIDLRIERSMVVLWMSMGARRSGTCRSLPTRLTKPWQFAGAPSSASTLVELSEGFGEAHPDSFRGFWVWDVLLDVVAVHTPRNPFQWLTFVPIFTPQMEFCSMIGAGVLYFDPKWMKFGLGRISKSIIYSSRLVFGDSVLGCISWSFLKLYSFADDVFKTKECFK